MRAFVAGFGRVVKVADAICDCLPGVSFLTNGLQLLYKQARKVDTASNPNGKGWTADIKIHVLNKTTADCLFGMIPFLGNLINLVEFALQGLRRELLTAVVRSNAEVVTLYLANHPLDCPKRAGKILGQAAFSSNPEVFSLILQSRQWNVHEIVGALRSCWCPNDNSEQNANKLLDYYHAHFPEPVARNESEEASLRYILRSFLDANRMKTAERLIEILPQSNFGELADMLATYSFASMSSFSKRGTLTSKNIEGILSRTSQITVKGIQAYCEKVHTQKTMLSGDIKFENSYGRTYQQNFVERDREKILADFYKVHMQILTAMLPQVAEESSASTIVCALSSLASKGELEFLKPLLAKYEGQLTAEDKLQLLSDIREGYEEETVQEAHKASEFLFNRYSGAFTDDQYAQLLKRLSKGYRNAHMLQLAQKARPHIHVI